MDESRPASWPDDTGCPILHVDMDAFYASVEIRDRPELRDRPVVVGGIGPRGVVCSANYPARTFGVRSAMPTASARRLCPQAVFLPPDFTVYHQVSQGVLGIFRDLTPLVEPLSLDEAFLDVAGALRRTRMTPAQLGAQLRARVEREHRISCSVGVAATKFLAKLASGMAKPDGMLVVPAVDSLAFLHPLPVSALWGVGERTAEHLARLGLATVADIAGTPLPRLRKVLGVAAAEHLHALANGRDDRAVVPDSPDKSVGAEETFDVDHHDRDLLRRELLRLAERTAGALRSRGLRGRTVSIKVRFADFTTITRSRTLPVATDVTQEVYRTACRLLAEQVPAGAVRLIGVRMEQLTHAAGGGEQLTLDAPERGWRDADLAADQARSRFGTAAVRPASLIPGDADRK
ncbi:MAG TPA: DNA polymerase IV [Pseudonocardiaceae bacterium]|nr:DNA polymerase IV [Pseudonocardiaceae bacterium]